MFFIRQNEVFIFFTWQYPHNKSRITPFSSNISVTIYRKMPNRARGLKQRNTTFNPPPLCFAQQNIGEVSEGQRGWKTATATKSSTNPLPLPCPAALRGVTYKIGAEAKGKYISPTSSVFCTAKYRGGGRRTEGLEKNKKKRNRRVKEELANKDKFMLHLYNLLST